MAWAVWLLIPAIATALAAAVTWLRHRPLRPPATDEAVRRHAEYLDALVQTARSKDRGPRADAGT
jgi:hypothetical protein